MAEKYRGTIDAGIPEQLDPYMWTDEGPGGQWADVMHHDIGVLYDFVGLNEENDTSAPFNILRGGRQETAEAGIQCNLLLNIKTWHVGTRQIVIIQEKALLWFRAGWSNFSDWVNNTVKNENKMTYQQSQCLFNPTPDQPITARP